MQFNFKSRSWHRWVSVSLSLPILVVALTAILMAHRKSLGAEEISVAAQWLPGYRSMTAKNRGFEARAALTARNGATYFGNLNGLYRLADGKLVAVDQIGTTQVCGLAEAPWGLVVAARNGIWLERDGQWKKVHKGEAWSVTARADGSMIVAVKDQGLLESRDGKRWEADAQLAATLAALPAGAAEPITLSRLVMDIHTGKALLGKDAEWIWIDLVALALSLLSLTGLWMWWRGQRRKPQTT
jgi:hypothetical protein